MKRSAVSHLFASVGSPSGGPDLLSLWVDFNKVPKDVVEFNFKVSIPVSLPARKACISAIIVCGADASRRCFVEGLQNDRSTE